jgi:hypothetical protein
MAFITNRCQGFFHALSFLPFFSVKLCFPPVLCSLKSVPHSQVKASTSNFPNFHFFLYSSYSLMQSGHFPIIIPESTSVY